MAILTLQRQIERIIAFRDARNWKQFHNPKDLALSLVLEAGEVMEHFQWKDAEEMQKHLAEHKEDVGKELADVLYWVLLMGHDFEIDVFEALEKKMAENEAKYPVDKAKGVHTKYDRL
jgi:NTP pyrophosphatase (non-canonical NTP hydrolase)